ncbi:MAG: HD domain-containing protein [Candidatus Eisenbacteria bacterium]|nr:HD domain-containing protein [Candidatus Eisenbacteria bacterium]
MAQLTFNKISRNHDILMMLRELDEQLGLVGYTEHGVRHAKWVGRTAQKVLEKLGKDEREAELAGIAGFMHDIGNLVNREDHAQAGALLAHGILRDLEMPLPEIMQVMSAIGNHDEEHAHPATNVAAALILADKADVHKSRVRNPSTVKFDIHDRVNYAVQKSVLEVVPERNVIRLNLTVNTKISQVMEYFEIFLSRMVVSRRAAEFLGSHYELMVNDTQLM